MKINKKNNLFMEVDFLFRILFGLCIFSAGMLTFEIAESRLLNMFLISFITFMFFTLLFFITTKNKCDRELIFKTWKTYISILVLMFVYKYTMHDTYLKSLLDYQKTKFTYELNFSKQDANTSFNTYDKIAKESLSTYFENFSEYKNVSVLYTKKPPYSMHDSLSTSIMFVSTLFMALYLYIELNIMRRIKYFVYTIFRKNR